MNNKSKKELWLEKYPFGYYNSETDKGTGAEAIRSCKPVFENWDDDVDFDPNIDWDAYERELDIPDDSDKYDDVHMANVYGGDLIYCRDCGARLSYMDGGYSYCPVCQPLEEGVEEESPWEMVAIKTVKDSDGFITEYAWYTDGESHRFIFGDTDLYDVNDTADWETDSYEEAEEWFNSYDGFEDEDEGDYVSDSDVFEAYDDDYEDDKPFKKSEILDELRRETRGWTLDSDEIYYGFESEWEYATTILKKHYNTVEATANNRYTIKFSDPKKGGKAIREDKYRDPNGKVRLDKWYSDTYPDDIDGADCLSGLYMDDAVEDRGIISHCGDLCKDRVNKQLDKYSPIITEGACDYVTTHSGCTVYTCDGKFICTKNGKSLSDTTLDGIKSKIDREDKAHRDHYNNLAEEWVTFKFTSGSNPYIAKDEKEVKRLLKKYGDKARKVGGNYIVDDKKEDKFAPEQFDESTDPHFIDKRKRSAIYGEDDYGYDEFDVKDENPLPHIKMQRGNRHIQLADTSKVGEEGHPIQVGLRGRVNKFESTFKMKQFANLTESIKSPDAVNNALKKFRSESNDYGCDKCGKRVNQDDAHWFYGASVGLCDGCYNRLSSKDREKLDTTGDLTESKKLNEGTGNFYYENRCVVVTDEDYDDGNVPPTEDRPLNGNRNFPQYPLSDYNDDLKFHSIVLTPGYYSGACIDFVEVENDGIYDDYKYVCENECDQIWYDDESDDWVKNGAWGKDDEHLTIEQAIQFIKDCLTDFPSVTTDDIRKALEEEKADGYYRISVFLQDSEIIDKIRESYSSEADKCNEIIDQIKRQYGYKEYATSAVFSNGETIYSEIDEKLDESLLQELIRDKRSIKTQFGDEVYSAFEEYLSLGNDLGTALYSRDGWNNFVKWANEKGIDVVTTTDSNSDDLFESNTIDNELYRRATVAYKKDDTDFFNSLTDDELVKLQVSCCITDTNPYGAAYDDEVYDAIADRPNSKELFDRATEIVVNKMSIHNLVRLYSRYYGKDVDPNRLGRDKIVADVLKAIRKL